MSPGPITTRLHAKLLQKRCRPSHTPTLSALTPVNSSAALTICASAGVSIASIPSNRASNSTASPLPSTLSLTISRSFSAGLLDTHARQQPQIDIEFGSRRRFGSGCPRRE